jgi:hypothetical protein
MNLSKSITQQFSGTSTGALDVNRLAGGVYVYGVNAVFGSSSQLDLEISFDGTTYVKATDLTDVALSDTGTGAQSIYHTFYAPAGSYARFFVTTAAMTSGAAWIGEAVSVNG